MRIRIKNGIIITLNTKQDVLYNHDLVIQDELIEGFYPKGTADGSFDKEIDATGKVIMPGYINAHMHFYSTMVRGLGKAEPSADFSEVLKNLWWRLDRKLMLEDVHYSALIMQIEAIKKGCTTLIDHHASPYAVLGSLSEIEKGFVQTGLRGSLCYELSDRDGAKIMEEGIQENIEFIKHTKKRNSDMLSGMFGMHASFTISDKTMQKAVDANNGFDTGFHIHCAEAESDQQETIKMTGLRVVERLHKAGVLGQKTICAHGVHLNEEEYDILGSTDTIIVHNPQSNMNNAVGIADLVKLNNHGILTGLGTDAMTVDMAQEVRVAMWAQHLKQENPTAAFMQVANTLYKNNALIVNRLFNGLQTGQINKGYKADVILCDYLAPTELSSSTALGHLIYGISATPVDTTICNGRILMENKLLTLDLDEVEINKRSRALSKELWKRF